MKAQHSAVEQLQFNLHEKQILKAMLADISQYRHMAEYLAMHRTHIEEGSVMACGYGVTPCSEVNVNKFIHFLEWVGDHSDFHLAVEEYSTLSEQQFRFICRMTLSYIQETKARMQLKSAVKMKRAS